MTNKIYKYIIIIIFSILQFKHPVFSQSYKLETHVTNEITTNKYSNTDEIINLLTNHLNLQKNQIIYTKVPRGIIISIDSNLFFNNGSDKLLDTSYPILHKLAQILNTLNKNCRIEAHTEATTHKNSKYESNWELSSVQAGKISNHLIKNEKIKPSSINAIGYGELMPFKSNVNYKQTMNNRIDFVILNYEK